MDVKPYASADCAEGTLKKHEGCFKYVSCNVRGTNRI